MGIGAGFVWMFSDDPEDCAGAIYYSPRKQRFTRSWDRDSINEALKDGKNTAKKCMEGPANRSPCFANAPRWRKIMDNEFGQSEWTVRGVQRNGGHSKTAS